MASTPKPDMPEPQLPADQPPGLPVPGAPEPEMEPSIDPQPEVTERPAGPEYGGREGPDPTRYGDWERRGVAVDF